MISNEMKQRIEKLSRDEEEEKEREREKEERWGTNNSLVNGWHSEDRSTRQERQREHSQTKGNSLEMVTSHKTSHSLLCMVRMSIILCR